MITYSAPNIIDLDETTTHFVDGIEYKFYHEGRILADSNNKIVAHVDLAMDSDYDEYDFYMANDGCVLHREYAPETNTMLNIGQMLAMAYAAHTS